jgi:hypothetical protein
MDPSHSSSSNEEEGTVFHPWVMGEIECLEGMGQWDQLWEREERETERKRRRNEWEGEGWGSGK